VGTTEQFLKIISDRARKEISPNIVYRTSMLVTSVIDNSKIKAIIPGDTVEYTLLNKTGEVLSAGNSVVVESNGTNLNNGVVAYKFGATKIQIIDSGVVSITPTSIDVAKSAVITFNKKFSATPVVVVTAQSSNPYNGVRECTCIPNSATQATIYLTRADLTATNISWIAIGE
jgi:hypothetical protein